MEFYENSQSPERALLIGVDTGEYNAEISMEELALLSETAGAEIIGTVIQKLEAPSPATYIGSGRMAEVAAFCRNNDIDLIIADSELTPSQINNIETLYHFNKYFATKIKKLYNKADIMHTLHSGVHY